MYTTLNRIKQHQPCQEGWKKLLKTLGKTGPDNEPLHLLTVLESNGIEDAIWALRAVDGRDNQIRGFAVKCARKVQHLMKDQRPLSALDVAEAHAKGMASNEELATARSAARSAAWATDAAAWAAADAAAWDAARDAAWDTAWDAARDAAWDAAWDAAYAAAWDAAWAAAARAEQEVLFRELVGSP